MFDFHGKNAVITGAASGIGKATAAYFHACGANVVLADRNLPALEAVADGIDAARQRVGAIQCDASLPESADAVVAHATKLFGNIDHIAACAGIYEEQLIDGMTDEQWRRTLAINLDGVFYLTRRAIPAMNDGGAIVAIASVAAHTGGSYAHAHYGASKGGVMAYCRGLSKDLAPRIRVNSVSPGMIETPMVAASIERAGERIKGTIPMKRFGKPSEVASVIAFLCSDAASYVTGETIIIAGGMYMG